MTIETTSQITIETVIASSVMIATSLIAVAPKMGLMPCYESVLAAQHVCKRLARCHAAPECKQEVTASNHLCDVLLRFAVLVMGDSVKLVAPVDK